MHHLRSRTRTTFHRRARGARIVPALALAGALVSACAGGDTAEPLAPALAVDGPPGSVVIVPDLFCPLSDCGVIPAGDSIHFFAYLIGEDGTGRRIQRPMWQVADTTIATVSADGWVVGRAPGEVRLIASLGPASGDTTVSVKAARITEVRIEAASADVPVGATTELRARLIDLLGNERTGLPVHWFSHNPAVATVDEQGVLRGAADGHVIVSAFGPDHSGGWISLRIGSGAPAGEALALADVSVGAAHACGVAPDGASYCWGWNYFGQLGIGFPSDASETFGTPLRVRSRVPFRAISAGGYHSCALATDDRAWCWGSNEHGQSGLGEVGGGTPAPTAVAGDAPFRSVSAGGDFTCALDVAGRALCWGANYDGQLGTGGTRPSGTPVPVATTTTFTTLRTGLYHSCALDAEGAAWCWGGNHMGQVGSGRIGDGQAQRTPAPVQTRARFSAIATAPASSHTCALTADGQIYCWGRNDSGQLGDGTYESRTRPAPVSTPLRFTAVAAGAHHSCGVAVDGTTHCWGNNEYAQLGDNSLTSRTSPAPVATTLRLASLTASNNTTCGRTTTGATHCWGSNHHAALGAGFEGWETLSAVPLPVAHPAPDRR